jgi:polysaccharide biosynthesis protein PslG
MKMARRLIPILVVALLATMPAAAESYLPPGFVGVSPQNRGTVKDYRLMSEAGIKSVRQPLVWAAIEPENPAFSERQWGYMDHEVRLAAEHGMEIFPFIVNSPKWVTAEGIDLPVAKAWQRRAWASFVRSVVNRYGIDGAYWREEEDVPYVPMRRFEIWNEQNIVTFASDPEPKRFAVLLRIAGRVIHRRQPGAKVIVGGLFGRPLQIPPNVASGDFLNRLYAAGNVKRYFDGVALHPYVADARAMAAQLRNLRRIMRAHGDRKAALYITELGWGSASGPTRWQRGYYGQARQLDKALSIISVNRVRWRIRGAWWFTWSDEKGGCLFCHSAGLLNEKREAKPAWYRFNRWTGGDAETVPKADNNGLDESEAAIAE